MKYVIKKIIVHRMITIASLMIITALTGCGAVKVLKEKERRSSGIELNEKMEISEDLRLQTSSLLNQWVSRHGLVTALIASDSAIVFDPDKGFEVSNGQVLYQRVYQESSATAEAARATLEQGTDSLAERDLKENSETKMSSTDKKRDGAKGWYGVLIVGIVIGLVVVSFYR